MLGAVTVAGRFALYGDLMALFGIAGYALIALRGAKAPLRAIVLTGGLIGLALTLALLLLLIADMAGTGLDGVDRESAQIVLDETAAGRATLWRAAALARRVLLGLLPGAAASWWRASAAFFGGIALATLAWNGHGAATEGPMGWPHLGADVVHLLASGLWLGALAMLLLRLCRRAPDAEHVAGTHRALAGFSGLGTLLVAAILLSGLVNLWVLVGIDHLPALFTTFYGQLLLAKLALFALMLMLAARNRFGLTPALAQAADPAPTFAALAALRRSVAIEAGAGVAIVALVALLGTLDPIGGM
jgi:putative copper resistance protein D